jgi:hypothetical protein
MNPTDKDFTDEITAAGFDMSRVVVVGAGPRSDELRTLLQREAGVTVIASGPNHPGDPNEGLARVGIEPDALDMDVKSVVLDIDHEHPVRRRARLGSGRSAAIMAIAASLAAVGGMPMIGGPMYGPTGRSRSRHLTDHMAEEREAQRQLDAARRAGVTSAFAAAYGKPPTEADRLAIEKAEAKRAMRAAKRRKAGA